MGPHDFLSLLLKDEQAQLQTWVPTILGLLKAHRQSCEACICPQVCWVLWTPYADYTALNDWSYGYSEDHTASAQTHLLPTQWPCRTLRADIQVLAIPQPNILRTLRESVECMWHNIAWVISRLHIGHRSVWLPKSYGTGTTYMPPDDSIWYEECFLQATHHVSKFWDGKLRTNVKYSSIAKHLIRSGHP